MSPGSSAWDEVHEFVRAIPAGKVMNYGQIARLLERPLSARAVGWALRNCPQDVPWHRVVNAAGLCVTDSIGHLPQGYQRALLESEGVEFRENGSIDMSLHRWRPDENA